MKRCIIFSILILLSKSVFSTGQRTDILIFENKKYALLDTPLELYLETNRLNGNLFGEKEGCFHTGCWRGYSAEWTIEKDVVFLTNIYSCCYYEDSLKSNLKELFGDKCVDGKVKADWISKELLVADGKMIIGHNDGFWYFFVKEKGFFIEKGNLVEVVDYDNSKTRKSEYFEDKKLLLDFIYSNIRWDSLPDLTDKKERVIVRFTSGETEKPEDIEVLRGSSNPVFDEEAKRVIGLLKWDVYYKKGKPFHVYFSIPVIFSQENKAKYSDR